MGADADQSRRGWRRHLRGVSRDRAAKSGGDAERGTLFFSARELGVLAINFIEWGLYAFLTWGVLYLVFSDQMPKLVQSQEPVYWLDTKPAQAPALKPQACLAVVEDISPTEAGLSPEFKRGFEAALQSVIIKLENQDKVRTP